MTITKEEFFKAGKISTQDKATSTDQAARQIVATEAALRAQKTQRLRALRAVQETEASLANPPVEARASKRRKA